MTEKTSGEPIVRLEGIHRSFGGVKAVDGVDLDVARGEFLAFLGPSGCGKTTLLRIIAGFESADQGRVVVAGEDVSKLPPERRPLNMVFQRYALFPHLAVEENVAFGLKLAKRPKAEIRNRVAELLELVQLSHCAKRRPQQISGGQAQRVALARALARAPEVLLLDEPLTALDRAVRKDLQEQLKTIQREVGTTFIYVTHDQEEAMAMSTRIALMNEGRIDQLAAPNELYRQPSSSFAASFVGDANILTCAVTRNGSDPGFRWKEMSLEGPVISPSDSRTAIGLMVRPEDVTLSPADPGSVRAITGTVTSSTFHGFYWMHELDIEGEPLVAREISEIPGVDIGQVVEVTIDARRAALLPD
ncbi:MAG: ABC transporter ATP-binding protein [Thermoleophilia bacterium]|nr:ABC transporter ATP-binding protein [Thermoleophilia bacterium]